MVCCRCNHSGRCLNCQCVKSGTVYQGCLPQRSGNCVNTVWTPPSQVNANIASPSPESSSPGLSSSSPFLPNTSPRLSLVLLSSPEHHSYTRVASYPCMWCHFTIVPVKKCWSSLLFCQQQFLLSPGVPVTLPPSITSSMAPMVKLCIGGQISSKLCLARKEILCFWTCKFVSGLCLKLCNGIHCHESSHFSTYSVATETFSQVKRQNMVLAWRDDWIHGWMKIWVICC